MTSSSADAHLSGRNADLPERRPAPDREAARPHLRSEISQAGALINEIAIMILSAPADEPYTHSTHTHNYSHSHYNYTHMHNCTHTFSHTHTHSLTAVSLTYTQHAHTHTHRSYALLLIYLCCYSSLNLRPRKPVHSTQLN